MYYIKCIQASHVRNSILTSSERNSDAHDPSLVDKRQQPRGTKFSGHSVNDQGIVD
jgi:hypothetical protein